MFSILTDSVLDESVGEEQQIDCHKAQSNKGVEFILEGCKHNDGNKQDQEKKKAELWMRENSIQIIVIILLQRRRYS